MIYPYSGNKRAEAVRHFFHYGVNLRRKFDYLQRRNFESSPAECRRVSTDDLTGSKCRRASIWAGLFIDIEYINPVSGFCLRIRRPSGQAAGAGVLAGLRAGDGPLSVRARPSSIKRDCGRRATRTGGRCPEERTREVTLDPGDLCEHSGQRPRARPSLPGPDAGHPLHSAGRSLGVS
jgi:hypothetical protein